jgi:hypothetical protein
MKCEKCNRVIPKARLKALPDTRTCVKCSEIKPKVGVTVWDKKTPEMVIIDEEGAKEFKHFENYGGRSNRLK